ncbi:hypothetical protein KY342_02830, partial [Candidatus Woesearchaeota archaeon]|nr:hypothetical protein [Candidatus Woesearchaeota archaeon]
GLSDGGLLAQVARYTIDTVAGTSGLVIGGIEGGKAANRLVNIVLDFFQKRKEKKEEPRENIIL